MTLPILAALVVGGISAVVLLVHGFGWTDGPPFATPAEAETVFKHETAAANIQQTVLADDGRSALFGMTKGTGILARFGRGTVARVLSPQDIWLIESTAKGLTIRLHDDSAPRLRIALADGDMRQAALRLLRPEGQA
jgi:hypothetical protein